MRGPAGVVVVPPPRGARTVVVVRRHGESRAAPGPSLLGAQHQQGEADGAGPTGKLLLLLLMVMLLEAQTLQTAEV